MGDHHDVLQDLREPTRSLRKAIPDDLVGLRRPPHRGDGRRRGARPPEGGHRPGPLGGQALRRLHRRPRPVRGQGRGHPWRGGRATGRGPPHGRRRRRRSTPPGPGRRSSSSTPSRSPAGRCSHDRPHRLVRRSDPSRHPAVGGKGANLGELTGPASRSRPGSSSPPRLPRSDGRRRCARPTCGRGSPRPARRRRSRPPWRSPPPSCRPWSREAGVPDSAARRGPGRLPPPRRRRPRRRALLGDGRGHRRHLVRRHARDVHQRRRRRRRARPDRRLLGVAVRRAGGRLPGRLRADRGAGDRGRRAADGRLRAGRRDVHRRPGDRRPRPPRDRGRVRARRGRGRRPGRARHLRRWRRTGPG